MRTLTCASTAGEKRIADTGVLEAGATGLGGGGGGVAAGLGGGGTGAAAACGGGGGGAAAAGAGADSAGFSAGLALTAPGLILNSCWPALTVSPSATKISSTTPATGVGTPTVVLSVSISITFWSACTSSPTFTVNLNIYVLNEYVLLARHKFWLNIIT